MPVPSGFSQHSSGYWMKATDQSGPYSFDGTTMTLVSAPIAPTPPAAGTAGYPTGAVPVTSSSGNVANANAVATLPGVAGKTTYVTGFSITGAGATAGVAVVATLTGLISGTASHIFTAPAGAMVGGAPLTGLFVPPIPASALNTAITLTLPALGVGNTNAAVELHGYQL